MGSSYVTLGKRIPGDEQTKWLGVTYGFWVKDGPLIALLTGLGELIDADAAAPGWLKELRSHWVDLEEIAGGGCVRAGFGDYVSDDQRRLIMLDVVLAAMQRLLDFNGDYYQAFPCTRPK